MPAMQGLLCVEFTIEEFEAYCRNQLSDLMRAWRPRGVVLHNTGKMAWPGTDPHTHLPLTPRQRIENISTTWVEQNFSGGPHFLITPKPSVVTMWPAWMPGTHSPKWNSSFWGMEMVGDFTIEPFPNAMRDTATRAMRALYAMLGHEITADSFHLHKEDPGTQHKLCPGTNCGDKATWLTRLNALLGEVSSQDLPHRNHLSFSEAMKAKLQHMEAFRDKAYQLKGIWHIGYGFRDGFAGLKLDANSTMTRAVADKLFAESMAALAEHIQTVVTKPLLQRELDAIGLFIWNVGFSGFSTSTILKDLNAGDKAGAGAAFDLWNKWHETPDGPLVVSPQLAARRAYERSVFEGRVSLTPVAVIAALPVAPQPLPPVRVAPGPQTPVKISPAATPVDPVPVPVAVSQALPPVSAAPPPTKVVIPVSTGPVPQGWWARFIAWLEDIAQPVATKA